jgi:hypothetical protein
VRFIFQSIDRIEKLKELITGREIILASTHRTGAYKIGNDAEARTLGRNFEKRSTSATIILWEIVGEKWRK